MASVTRTLVRAAGVLLLGASAVALYRPGVLEAPRAQSRIATVPVVVANKDMPEGAIVDRVALIVAQWPAGTQPAGAYTTVDSVANRVTRVAVYRGEAIVPGRLAPEGTGAGLTVKITPGKRAYGIRINDVASLAGMVQPNSRVDVMVVVNDPDQRKQVAKLFMENMRVLAIRAAPSQGQDGRPITAAVASIEVTPIEAERLAIAASQGALQLVLRGFGDADSTHTKGAAANDVLTDLKRLPPVPVRKEELKPSPCGPPNNSVFHDLLRRSCAPQELKFQRDSAARNPR